MTTSGQWVERQTMRGYTYRGWQSDDRMPRIQQRYLDCSIYLYSSKQSAEAGENFGGSGCLVSVQSEPVYASTPLEGGQPRIRIALTFPPHPYAVTNRHVIQHDCPVIRLNTVDGQIAVLEREPHQWILHPDGDDLAIAPIDLPANRHKYYPIGTNRFIHRDTVSRDVGAGDDTFMIGRFTSHDGKQRNTPSMRFGNIAMLPFEKIKLSKELNSYMQEAFLVETRSLSGYSGSPVFVYKPAIKKTPMYKDRSLRLHMPSQSVTGLVGELSLLGIDCGHVQKYEDVVNGAGTPHSQWKVKSNTGMAIVIPAWRLSDLLNIPELVMPRKQKDKQYQEEKEAEETVVMDVEKPEPFTEDSYLDALRRASRKSSEPESEKKLK